RARRNTIRTRRNTIRTRRKPVKARRKPVRARRDAIRTRRKPVKGQTNAHQQRLAGLIVPAAPQTAPARTLVVGNQHRR
nr:hypothetical protein [Acidimicrobiia bacterium]